VGSVVRLVLASLPHRSMHAASLIDFDVYESLKYVCTAALCVSIHSLAYLCLLGAWGCSWCLHREYLPCVSQWISPSPDRREGGGRSREERDRDGCIHGWFYQRERLRKTKNGCKDYLRRTVTPCRNRDRNSDMTTNGTVIWMTTIVHQFKCAVNGV
jgi:hypothetical protein